MASQLKVDTLTGVTTAGSIDVTGEGNSTTTNLQQGLAKAWGQFQGTGTVAVTNSSNFSSITDNGTGSYSMFFLNSMSGSYSVVSSTGESNTSGIVRVGGTDASSVLVNTRVSSSGSSYDDQKIYMAVHGDLA